MSDPRGAMSVLLSGDSDAVMRYVSTDEPEVLTLEQIAAMAFDAHPGRLDHRRPRGWPAQRSRDGRAARSRPRNGRRERVPMGLTSSGEPAR